jgi:FtsH-binding integral membrane protein
MSDFGADQQTGAQAVPGTAYDERAFGAGAAAREDPRALFGHVMGLVALTVGCAALGAYLARNFTGGTGIVLFVLALGCIIGLNIAVSRRRDQLAIGFLFGLGLLLGASVGPLLAVYAETEPAALWQAVGATAAFVALLGTFGYATQRDLSAWGRTLFWALLALIAFGIVLLFVSIPHGHVVYAVIGLVIFGGFTVFDFNRLRRAGTESAVPIAASIFLDIFNVFLLLLQLFGGERR